MKVVQINSVCGVGSTGKIVENISKLSWKNNVENYIFYGIGKSEYKYAKKIGNDWNVKKHIIKTRLFGKHGFYSEKVTNNLIKEIERIKPDLIHLHNMHGHYINIKILFEYLAKLNKPIIWTLHDCWSFTGHCSHFEFENCNKWKKKCEKCSQLKKYPKSLIFDRTSESFNEKKILFNNIKKMTIVTPSKWLSELVKESFLSKAKIKIINNGVDLSVFKAIKTLDLKRNNEFSDKFVILGVAASFTKLKGIEYFIKLSKLISKDMQIILIGLTEEQLKKIPSNIIGIKSTNNQKELVEFYSKSDVFLNLTLEDTFPTTNIEALSCGTPVITFKTGGSPEIIDEKTGIVVEKGNLDQVIDALENIRNIKKENYSKSCVKRAKQFYDSDNNFKKYIELYKETIEQ